MNSDEIKSLVVKILLVVFSSLAAKYHISGDTVTAVASDVADLGVIGYGIYDHWNMKKVAETREGRRRAAVCVPGDAKLRWFCLLISDGRHGSSQTEDRADGHSAAIAEACDCRCGSRNCDHGGTQTSPLATAQTNLISVIEAFSVTDLQNAILLPTRRPRRTGSGRLLAGVAQPQGNPGRNPDGDGRCFRFRQERP